MGKVFLQVVLRHPVLAAEALRLALATAKPGWLLKPPFLPRPEPTYRDWRLATAYGRADVQPSTAEVVEYLQWRRSMRQAR